MRFIPRTNPVTGILLAVGALAVTMAGPVIVSATADTQATAGSCLAGGVCMTRYTPPVTKTSTSTTAPVTATSGQHGCGCGLTATTTGPAVSTTTGPLTSTTGPLTTTTGPLTTTTAPLTTTTTTAPLTTTTTAAPPTTTTPALTTTTTGPTTTGTTTGGTSTTTGSSTGTTRSACGAADGTQDLSASELEICQPASLPGYIPIPAGTYGSITNDTTDGGWVSLGRFVLEQGLYGVVNACEYVPQPKDIAWPGGTNSHAEVRTPVDAMVVGSSYEQVSTTTIIAANTCP